jgi:hypothetical protein
VNQDENLSLPRWLTRPPITLAFDESQFLTDLPQGHNRTRTLFTDAGMFCIGSALLPIFSLFVSKAGRFYLPPPKIRLHPSVLHDMHPPPVSPITEVGFFYDLAYGAMKNIVMSERVVHPHPIAHLGRPAYIIYIYFTSCFGPGELLSPMPHSKTWSSLLGHACS